MLTTLTLALTTLNPNASPNHPDPSPDPNQVRCPRVGGMAALVSVLAAELGLGVASSAEIAADGSADSAAGGSARDEGGDALVAATMERLVEARLPDPSSLGPAHQVGLLSGTQHRDAAAAAARPMPASHSQC